MLLRYKTPAISLHAELLSVAWPILAEMLLMQLAGILSLWLISRISDQDAAIFAMVNHIIFSIVLLFRIVSMGCGVVIAQHLGGSNKQGAADVARAALASNLLFGLASGLLLWLSADVLLRWMNMPLSLQEAARFFLQMLALSLSFEAASFVITTVLRAHKHSRPTLWLNVTTLVVHFAIALPLMFGWLGLPSMGLQGLIISTLVSRLLAFFLGLWLWDRLLQLRLQGSQWWRWQAGSLRGVLHIGLPGAGETLAYRLSFMIILAMVAEMGPSALATHTYTHQLMTFILLFGLAMGLATEIIVGHCVGAGQLHRADRFVHTALVMSLAVSFILSLSFAFLGHTLLGFFTKDAQIIATGSQLLWLCLILEVGRSFNLVVINGLRAAGDVKFPLFAGIGSMFFVAAGLSWLLGQHLGWGLVGIWLACALDEWLRGLAMYWRWRRRIWIKSASHTYRDIKRLAALRKLDNSNQRSILESSGR